HHSRAGGTVPSAFLRHLQPATRSLHAVEHATALYWNLYVVTIQRRRDPSSINKVLRTKRREIERAHANMQAPQGGHYGSRIQAATKLGRSPRYPRCSQGNCISERTEHCPQCLILGFITDHWHRGHRPVLHAFRLAI